MKNKFKLKIGDPSNDGHGQCETFIISCNKTTTEINTAYKKSCELTGLVFTENTDIIVDGERMNWEHPEYNDRKLCVEYESFDISELAWSILAKHGLQKDDYLIDGYEDLENEAFVDLFFDFITLSLSDLDYKLEQDGLPTIDLSIGYGRFS